VSGTDQPHIRNKGEKQDTEKETQMNFTKYKMYQGEGETLHLLVFNLLLLIINTN
jgi:hypothetical protein